jgi:hypothetical protein
LPAALAAALASPVGEVAKAPPVSPAASAAAPALPADGVVGLGHRDLADVPERDGVREVRNELSFPFVGQTTMLRHHQRDKQYGQ